MTPRRRRQLRRAERAHRILIALSPKICGHACDVLEGIAFVQGITLKDEAATVSRKRKGVAR
jgi:hypothetical protein